MTEDLFFDTDCLSAFLWVNHESVLTRLYRNRIILPAQVYSELSAPPILHLKQKIDSLVASGEITIMSIESESIDYQLYQTLTMQPDEGYRYIGRGEAAAIVLAKQCDGILASNNLRDIMPYVKRFGLKHITSAEIMVQALNQNLITEEQGNRIWTSMINKRRKLPCESFTDYLKGR